MAGIGPPQPVLAREIRDARGGDVIASWAGTLGERDVGPTEQATGIVRVRRRCREGGSDEGRAPRRGQTVPQHVTDDQDGGVLWSFDDEIEVAADALGGGRARRGKLDARPLGKLGWRQRIPDRAEILELVLGGPEVLAHSGF